MQMEDKHVCEITDATQGSEDPYSSSWSPLPIQICNLSMTALCFICVCKSWLSLIYSDEIQEKVMIYKRIETNRKLERTAVNSYRRAAIFILEYLMTMQHNTHIYRREILDLVTVIVTLINFYKNYYKAVVNIFYYVIHCINIKY